MKKAFIFGASVSGRKLYEKIKNEYHIVGFIDNDCKLHGQKIYDFKIYSLLEALAIDVDYYIIGTYTGLNIVKNQLIENGIPENKILTKYAEFSIIARQNFLYSLSQEIYFKGIKGNVAELGVFQGEFAKEINKAFPDRKLYLFDTFEGFDKRDIEIEHNRKFSTATEGQFSITNVDMVMDKMSYKENIIIKKGYFPETALNVNDEFCFVNIDFDLYKPILEGLKFFYSKLVDGGIILIHEYFCVGYDGVKQAVEEFRSSVPNLKTFPIGDILSLGIIK